MFFNIGRCRISGLKYILHKLPQRAMSKRMPKKNAVKITTPPRPPTTTVPYDLAENKVMKAFYDSFQNAERAKGTEFAKVSKSCFSNLIGMVETEEDVKAILFAIPNFLGHRIPILNKEYDYLVRKTITLECPELIFDLLKHHEKIRYFPAIEISLFLAQYFEQKDQFQKIKEIFQIIQSKSFILIHPQFYNIIIYQAFHNTDYECVLNSFMNILDHTNCILEKEIYQLVRISNQRLYDESYIEEFLSNVLNQNKIQIIDEQQVLNYKFDSRAR